MTYAASKVPVNHPSCLHSLPPAPHPIMEAASEIEQPDYGKGKSNTGNPHSSLCRFSTPDLVVESNQALLGTQIQLIGNLDSTRQEGLVSAPQCLGGLECLRARIIQRCLYSHIPRLGTDGSGKLGWVGPPAGPPAQALPTWPAALHRKQLASGRCLLRGHVRNVSVREMEGRSRREGIETSFSM